MHGHCVLNIHLHQFENMHDAVIRPKDGTDRVCCCDQGNSKCKQNLAEFSTKITCSSNKPCDTYFNVSLVDYEDFAPFPEYSLSDTDRSTTTDVNYDFQFFLSDVPGESVRLHACVQE